LVWERAMGLLNDRGKGLRGARVLALGVAYKKDIDDPRESPSAEVIHLLHLRGADVTYHDPFVPVFTEHGLDMTSEPLTKAALESADLVLILTDHTSVDYAQVVRESSLVLDTRNATRTVVDRDSNVILL